MSTLNRDLLHVTKARAAKYQLTCAIRLYFEDTDLISCHTLAAACHELARGVGKPIRISSMIFGPGFDYMPEPHKTNFARLVKNASNFFKHADKDPTATLDFSPAQTEFLLMDAEQMVRLSTGSSNLAMRLFAVWFYLRHEKYRAYLDCSPEDRIFINSILEAMARNTNIHDKTEVRKILAEHDPYSDEMSVRASSR